MDRESCCRCFYSLAQAPPSPNVRVSLHLEDGEGVVHCRSLGRSALARRRVLLAMTKHFQLPKLWQCALKKEIAIAESFFEGGGSSWRLACQLIVDPGSRVFGRFPPFQALMQSSLFARPASWVSCWAQCQPVVNYHRPTDDLTADAWPTPGSCRRQFFQNYFNLLGDDTKVQPFQSTEKYQHFWTEIFNKVSLLLASQKAL